MIKFCDFLEFKINHLYICANICFLELGKLVERENGKQCT